MYRHGVALFAVTLAACASAPTSPSSAPESWKDCHCDWLEQETRAIAGPQMKECGFVDLVEDASPRRIRAGMRCARQAFEGATPFRYGSISIPIDSYAREILIRSGDGTLWLVTHDVMIDGEAPQLWRQRCKELRFKTGDAGYVISGCENTEASAQ